MRFLYVVGVVLLVKLIINLSKYLSAKRYLNRYMLWLAQQDSNLLEHKAQVIKLLKDAGVQDNLIGTAEPMGFGYIQTGSASVFANFPNNREDVAQATFRMFNEAISTYRSRITDTFNPLYWIESVINLPKQVLTYLGLSSESVIIKLAQLVWWVSATAFGIVYALYKPEVEAAVKSWLNKMMQ